MPSRTRNTFTWVHEPNRPEDLVINIPSGLPLVLGDSVNGHRSGHSYRIVPGPGKSYSALKLVDNSLQALGVARAGYLVLTDEQKQRRLAAYTRWKAKLKVLSLHQPSAPLGC
jgi:hypothetical protein